MGIVFNSSLKTLSLELKWLEDMIAYSLNYYFEAGETMDVPIAPDLSQDQSFYGTLVNSHGFDEIERLVMIIALAPHMRPSIFDVFFTKNKNYDRYYAEFGGIKGEKHGGFLPTGETAAFIIAGLDLDKRFRLYRCFEDDHNFAKENILSIGFTSKHEPLWSGELIVSQEFLSHVTLNEQYKPRYSPTFPAHLLSTKLDWSDAFFEHSVQHDLAHIQSWIASKEKILSIDGMNKYLKNGYRALFYGPPGTGKSMTSALIGKSLGMDVYRIDLSSIVSKYIGETEKNLESVFKIAENKGWILFFDEADALFSKRMSTSSSNDMFANQQVSYLLQRIEDFNGVAILATNFKDNIDDAFLRRFQSIVYFPKPNQSIRAKLWKKYFSSFDIEHIDIDQIAADYEISGGSMLNVLRYCAIEFQKSGKGVILQKDLITGIKKEFTKQGQTM
ncbi:MAG: hypothetical protein ACJA2S_005451 [Cyclobacteriaceae bacterium]|jgi:hypothetical protein